ncbi:Na+/H+ antiporter NhaA [Microlunatus sp. Y2014]|uniref:Na+/H+ antiporter NhaA n=1 Tax=Microlunatus sp. Y2014 TaxID=3418488 RepID=UPI003DA75070
MTTSTADMSPYGRVRRWVTRETTGGVLLLVAAALALVWANSPWRSAYTSLSELVVGPAALHLDLSLASWAADGLLAVFFFTVGLELKHELVAGSLRRPREAAVPVLAAVGGMVLPAVVFVTLVAALGDPGALPGWAIPTATDIAFALAVLAIFGRGLPLALRTFLLTLAVVDDLLAIIVIAVFYTAEIQVLPLVGSLVGVAAFGVLTRLKWARWWLLLPLGLVAWILMHASGVHATIAGVLLGLVVPATTLPGEPTPRVERYDDTIRPLSAAVALPVFAFFAAGVTVVDGPGGPLQLLGQPVVVAITAGLVLGKLAGVLGVTALVTRLTPLRLPDSIGLRDLLPIGFLTGMGFTVSLLITELSYPGDDRTAAAKVAVLLGTMVAAALAAITLVRDARQARGRDMNEDGVPDSDTGRIGDESHG